ncbi:hypothetical protein Gpo141_00001007 [Globisporangium polare]
MGIRSAVARSPSTADLQRQPSTSRLALGFATQIASFQRTRSRSAITVESTQTPKLIVPVRVPNSAHGSNNSSSHRGRNSQSRNSQSRKAHPSESRYSNRSYRDKSSRRHEVEVEDLNSETPTPVLPRQDASVYPSAAAQARHGGTPSPPVVVHSGSSDRAAVPAAQVAQATSSSSSSRSSQNGYTSTLADRILWVTKALLYAGLGAFYGVSAAAYEVFPETRHVATLRARLLGPEPATSSSVSRRLYLVACVGFACTHFGSLLRMILSKVTGLKRIRVAPVVVAQSVAATSEREKQMVFSKEDQIRAFNSNNSDKAKAEEESSRKKQMATRPPSQVSNSSSRNPHFLGFMRLPLAVYQRLLESESSAAFETEYLKLRVVQLALHTWLAILISAGVPSLGLNRLYAAAIVLSCWVPALIQLRMRCLDSESVHKRLCCVAAALMLDATAVVVIPLAILSPYSEVHNEQRQFSLVPSQYSDSWLVTMLLDSQFLHGNSLSHTILSICLGVNIAMILQVSVPVTVSSSSRRRSSASSVNQVSPGRTQSGSTIAVGDQRPQMKKSYVGNTRAARLSVWLSQSTPGRLLQSPRLSITALVLLAWGLSALICHLVTVSRSQALSPGCLVLTFPWHQRQPACALLELSCVPGEPQDLTSLLGPLAFDDQSLQFLVISDCESLHLTSRLRDFRELFGLRIRNSSLVAWDADATLSSLFHPSLRALSLSSVRVAIPSTLATVSRWRNLALLYLELADLDEFPSEILRLPLVDLSLSGNAIKQVPKELFEVGTELTRLWLNGNPISELPNDDKLQLSPALTLLSLDSTNLSNLPAWLSAGFAAKAAVFLGGTPLCAEGSLDKSVAALSQVSCASVSTASCT